MWDLRPLKEQNVRAKNIEWNIDIDDAIDTLNGFTCRQASEQCGIPAAVWADMNEVERYNYAYDYFRHCPGALDDLMGLPDEVDIPSGLTDEEDVTNWLSDTYGFFIEGYTLSKESCDR